MKFYQGLSLLLAPFCACAPREELPPVFFADAAQGAGVDFHHVNGARGEYHYVETFGAGAAFLDYDLDGWLDLYLVNGTYLSDPPPGPLPRNRLYRNRGDGTFAPVDGAADPGYGMGACAADYDSDGDPDLYVTNFGANALYRNDGHAFAEVAAASGVDDGRWGSSCGFLDYDLDGDVDLFAVNYVRFAPEQNPLCTQGDIRSYCQPDAFEPTFDLLYRNDGHAFAEVAAASGIDQPGRGLGVALADYDSDGDTDVYVANDGTMNFLYANQGGRFAELGLQAGVRYNGEGRAEAGMGVDFGDFDNDLDPDIYVTNFALETNTLYRHTSPGQFHDATEALGLATPSFAPLGFGTRFLDYDHDGFLDLFVANGHVADRIALIDSAQTYAQPNQMLRNIDGQRFADVSADLGPAFAAPNVGRGAAVADYDNDGDLDLVVCVQRGPARLLRNDGGNQGHWLQLALVGADQTDALGARAMVEAGGRRQLRERQSGGSYLSSHDPRLHFGLGRATRARVEVVWPDGERQVLEDVAADQVLVVRQPRR